MFNLRLHATQATHRVVHVLDLIITRNDDESFIHTVDVQDSTISDHFTLMCSLDIRKPRYEKKKAGKAMEEKSITVGSFEVH